MSFLSSPITFPSCPDAGDSNALGAPSAPTGIGLRIAGLTSHVGTEIQLQAYAMNHEIARTVGGDPFCRLVLGDCTGSLRGVILCRDLQDMDLSCLPGPVRVSGKVVLGNKGGFLRISNIEQLSPDKALTGAGLLPITRCPAIAHQALGQLVHLERELPPVLRDFLIRVLLDPEIGMPWLTARGGWTDHHAYPGGLLVHVTRLLGTCKHLAHEKFPGREEEVALTLLGYLLHDIGKVVTCATGKPTTEARTVSHETLGFQLLAPHTRWLRDQNEKLSSTLVGILDFVNGKTPSNRAAGFLGADIVKLLDALDAADPTDRDIEGFIKRPRPTVWQLKQEQRSRQLGR
ncbi:MAG: HD domain-containing protein [Algiphilus sp.]